MILELHDAQGLCEDNCWELVMDKIRQGFDNCKNGSGHKMVYYTALSSFLCV